MARPYSLDLRVRVVAAVDEGQSCRSVAEAFGLSNSCVVKRMQRVRTIGSAAPGKIGGHRRQLLAGHRDFILARLAAEPHLALRSLQVELIERGVAVSYGGLWNFVHRLGQSFKKSVLPTEQDRPDVARRRQRWKKHQGWIDPARLIFIDETWTKTNMAPLRGWCRRGERLRAKVPHGHWKTMTFLAALRCDRIEAPWLLDGPINSESFRVYIEHVLLPTLKRGDVVIIDNLGSHKGQAIRTLIRSADAKLLFLLPYSIHRALGNVVARRSFYEGTVDDDLSGVRSSRCSAP